MGLLTLISMLTSIRNLLGGVYSFQLKRTEKNRKSLQTQLKKLATTQIDCLIEINRIHIDLKEINIQEMLKMIQVETSDVEESLQSLDHTLAELMDKSHSQSLLEFYDQLKRLRLAIREVSKNWLSFRKAIEAKNVNEAKNQLEGFWDSLEKSSNWLMKLARSKLGISDKSKQTK